MTVHMRYERRSQADLRQSPRDRFPLTPAESWSASRLGALSAASQNRLCHKVRMLLVILTG
jgi:hypothetical protein